MDRLAPTRRPEGPAAGVQRWRDLLFLHWRVDRQAAARLLPRGLQLDLWEGEAYVGVVPFVMQGVRPWRWWPAAAAFRFLEANVRLYVVHDGEPGVYFLSLDAASRLAVAAARRWWGLPYHHARMSISKEGREVRYQMSRRGGGPRHRVGYRIGEPLGESREGTPEFFFLERYLLFVDRGRRIWRGQVHHQPYPAATAEVLEVEDQLAAAAGLPCQGPPAFAHYSPGVEVELFALAAAGG